MFQIENAGSGKKATVRLIDTEANSSATILPGFGFNCSSFVCQVHGSPFDVMFAGEGFPNEGDRASHHGTPILAPFPNRIRQGKYTYQGVAYELPLNEHGKNAIHGFVIDQPWRVTDQGASDEQGAWVRGEFQLSKEGERFRDLWPGDFRLGFTYRLRGTSLVTEIDVENSGDRPVPFGVGTHPYFRFPQSPETPLSECEIVCPLAREVKLIDCLPTGGLDAVGVDADLRKGMAFDRRKFDDVFAGIEPSAENTAVHHIRDHRAKVELRLEHDLDFKFVVVYTPPDRKSICIEPYTCVTDAINLEGSGLETGLWTLAPGERRRLTIRYDVRPLA